LIHGLFQLFVCEFVRWLASMLLYALYVSLAELVTGVTQSNHAANQQDPSPSGLRWRIALRTAVILAVLRAILRAAVRRPPLRLPPPFGMSTTPFLVRFE
jgi:ABC-type uncharacterized transport system permease subunit